MEKDCEYFMNLISSVLKDESSLDSIKNLINPNYTDKNGNGIYHYFSEYSLEKFYIINYNQNKNELIKEEKYKEIIEQYKKQIPLYIAILDQLKCDFNLLNKDNNSPLIYSIINNNYYITKEYLKKLNNMKLITDDIMYKMIKMCLNSGNCLRKDCIQLIVYILFIAKQNNINLFEKEYLNNKDDYDENFPIFILFVKDYNKNIIEKYNSIIDIKTSKYFEIYYGNDKWYEKEECLERIQNESKNDFYNFLEKMFHILFNFFILSDSSVYNSHNKKENFINYINMFIIYLYSYPFINARDIMEKYNTNINYQDNFGNTALMYYIMNEKKIEQISKNRYTQFFNFFISNKDLKIELTNNEGISAFGLSLITGCFNGAIYIYLEEKFFQYRLQFNFEILIFVMNYINDTLNYKRIYEFLNRKNNIFDLNDFNTINKRTLFHYLNIYSSDDIQKLYIYKEILYHLFDLSVDLNKKDIFERNALFYLFINDNEKIKNIDPYLKLEFCLEIINNTDLNNIDIYGNSLIFYAVQAKAYNSIKLLVKNNISLDIINKEGNTIYSIAAILGDFDLFKFLYQIHNNNNIFLQKVYSSKQVERFKVKENNIKPIIDLYKKMNVPISNKIIVKDKIIKEIEEKNLKNNQYSNIKISRPKFKSNYMDLYNDEMKKLLYETNEKIKVKNIDEEYKFNIEQKDFIEIKNNFYKDLTQLINDINKEKSIILGDSLFYYCKSKKNENICNFIINNNYHLISICNDLLSLKEEDEFNYYIHQMSYEKDLLNYKNEENITVFHILSKIQNDLSFYSENKLNKYDISNIYDNLGNTPIYYACYKLNIIFIETFTNYSFELNNNNSQNVKYSLFLETKNKTSPLKSLYVQLNKKDMKILKLIIDISINTKKVYILHVLLYLIKNYKSSDKDFFNSSYKDNINDNDYLRKIIGLYLFYTEELKGNFSNEELQDVNPIFSCFNFKNFDFLFDVLLKQKNIDINAKNKEGKNLIHLIVEMKEEKNDKNINKEDILNKALEYEFEIKALDNNGKAPIYYAVLNKEYNIKKILLKKYEQNDESIPDDNNKS